ncbi:MAG: protein translocase subunit SecD [Verrucomicrobiales bacterium]
MFTTLIFFFGLLLLGLFIWYFATDSEQKKRLAGTILTVLLTGFCIYAVTNFGITKGIDIQGGSAFTIRLDPGTTPNGTPRSISNDEVQQAIGVLQERLDPRGDQNLLIQPQGETRIVLQMPGVSEDAIAGIRTKIEQVAKLDFRLVKDFSFDDEKTEVVTPGWEWLPSKNYEREVAEKIREAKIKAEKAGKTEIDEEAIKGDVIKYYLVKSRPDLEGFNGEAFASYDVQGWMILLNFDSEGGEAFGKLTTANVGQSLAIVMDEEVLSAPRLNEPITGGRCQITGEFTGEEARALASSLQNPLKDKPVIEEERTVSAAYGEATVKQGIYAGVAGLVVTLIFMMIYYRFSGIIALIGLSVNVILIFGSMAVFRGVMTMPGIAGIVLTIGIAIDANVLIYERLREELAAGKSLRAAIEAAYDKAFSAIFDANITTLMTAGILFVVASGVLKGFAVTLTLGILCSLFSALLVTRVLFGIMGSKGKLKKLSMMNMIPENTFDFLGKAKMAAIVSLGLIVMAAGVFGVKGKKALGIEFRGGDQLEFSIADSGFSESKVIDSITGLKATIEGEGGQKAEQTIGEFFVQQQQAGDEEFLTIRCESGWGIPIQQKLEADLGKPLAEPKLDRVGSAIGKELAESSLMALGLGFLAILLYVTFRFEFSFALGAMVALIHDVIITAGLCSLFGLDISLILVSAFLTIAGYSINDTIVVFDRIRETLQTTRGSIANVFNTALNATLSRTLLTGLTTLIALLTLYVFGGSAMSDFALCMIIGVLIGTYSSVFVASPITLWWARKRKINLRREVLDTELAKIVTPGAEKGGSGSGGEAAIGG